MFWIFIYIFTAFASGKKSFNFAYFDKMLEVSNGDSFLVSPLLFSDHLEILSKFASGKALKELEALFNSYEFFEYNPSQIIIKDHGSRINFIDKRVAIFASEDFFKKIKDLDIIDSVFSKIDHVEILSENPTEQINNLIEKHTLGMGEKIDINLPTEKLDLLLFSNLYLKCFWERVYDRSKKMMFYRSASDALNVEFLYKDIHSFYFENEKFIFVFDNFFDSGGVLFAKPKNGYSFRDLTEGEFDEFFHKATRKKLRIKMPAFEIFTKEKDSIEAISKLGVKDIFSPNAELVLGLKNFVQTNSQNKIRFDRNGVVASATNLYTSIFGGGKKPDVFSLNEPFAFFVIGFNEYYRKFDIKSLSCKNIILEGVFTGKGDVKFLQYDD